jgi:uncharacterized RDD family membrane protein YckC
MEDFQKIAPLENEDEGSRLRERLEQQNIPHLVRSYHDPASDGLNHQTNAGWGCIEAPEKYRAYILKLLASMRGQPASQTAPTLPHPSRQIYYSSIVRRVQAAFIDSLFLLFSFIFAGVCIGYLFPNAIFLKPVPFMIILLYEPLALSIYGRTLGYRVMNQRVVRADNAGNLNLFTAFIRFFFKVFFGWLSLLWMLTTRRYQALHDMIVGSVVTVEDVDGEQPELIHGERKEPRTWLAAVIIVLYLILLLIAVQTA